MIYRQLLPVCLTIAGAIGFADTALWAQATHTASDWAQPTGPLDDGDALKDFQSRFRSSLFLLNQSPDRDQPVELSAQVTAVSRTGIRCLKIRNFQILSDGARETGEFELGAGSWPSVVGVLGSAVAGDFLSQATAKGIPIDELEVVFTSRPGRAASQSSGKQVTYPRNLTYTIFVTSPASDEQLEELRQSMEKVSPVLNLVSQAQSIDHGTLVYTQTSQQPDRNTLQGLREFLEDKQAASQGAVPPEPQNSSGKKRNDWMPPLRAHVKVEGGTGIRHIRADFKNFQVIHDYPRFLSGHNLGPVPEEHILGTMITCLTHIYEIEAARQKVVLDTLELDVTGTLSSRLGNLQNPPRYTRLGYTVKIGSPESKERIEALQRSVEAVCPIYNMLKETQPLKGAVLRGPYTEAKEKGVTVPRS